MGTKYQLETIPVWDGIKSESECFICDLMEQAQKDSVEFYLGSSVMNPETRVKVNSVGFCPQHTSMLVQAGHPNSMAVLWESHLAQTKDKLERTFKDMANTRNLKKTVLGLDSVLGAREQGCLICQRMQGRLDRYCFTIPYIWGQDPEFRKAFEQSKGFCLHHMSHILKMATEALDAKQQKLFAASMADLQLRNLERVSHDLWYMTEHYKSENRDKPWNGCENAQVRAVYKEIGRGRTIREK